MVVAETRILSLPWLDRLTGDRLLLAAEDEAAVLSTLDR
jgi:hypothetical protein